MHRRRRRPRRRASNVTDSTGRLPFLLRRPVFFLVGEDQPTKKATADHWYGSY
jgi:hypothetical protein